VKFSLLILATLCGIFGRDRQAAPQRPPIAKPAAAGKWFVTPHYEDGRWVEHTAQQMADKTGIKAWAQYPFSSYRWEWPGITDQDTTWIVEGPPGKQQPRPKPREWIPEYDPFLPGQRGNL
jgi:hypothetical protein